MLNSPQTHTRHVSVITLMCFDMNSIRFAGWTGAALLPRRSRSWCRSWSMCDIDSFSRNICNHLLWPIQKADTSVESVTCFFIFIQRQVYRLLYCNCWQECRLHIGIFYCCYVKRCVCIFMYTSVFVQRALNYFLHAAEAGNTNAMAYLGKVSVMLSIREICHESDSRKIRLLVCCRFTWKVARWYKLTIRRPLTTSKSPLTR